ncbi:AIR synthase family protein [Anaerostipes sp.]|uniref:AIR synthase family protein n=1 Tax=Anaerostipes sp. TaxID=1872530 RepID=UPI0025C14769|nr:AIR synthase family protein [Anaerostipes sp.]MBS7006985.1 AIR synthase family protein [Anaerostipes sp.]
MKIGKIPESTLKKVILEQLGTKRDEVLIGPGIGEDCAALKLGEGEVFVLSTDPITGADKEAGRLAVHVTANDLVSSGAEPVGLMLTVLLPPETKEKELKQLAAEMQEECVKLGIAVIGGHTEVTDAVRKPLISVTGVGKVKEDRLLSTKGARPGQDIVVTKYIGLEGTGIIASEQEDLLKERFSEDFLDEAKACLEYISVVPEGKIAGTYASAMHDITEGGIYGALWEVAQASGVGLEVSIEDIPVKQHTVELCEFFNLNPYQLISSGSMLITTDHGNALVRALEQEGIKASVIGRTTDSKDKIIYREGKAASLEAPKQDELYKIGERS